MVIYDKIILYRITLFFIITDLIILLFPIDKVTEISIEIKLAK